MFRPFALLVLLVSALVLTGPAPVAAQEGEVYIQVEAQPDVASARVRAEAYSALFPETNGFGLRSGWFGVLLGPYPPAEAAVPDAETTAAATEPADLPDESRQDARDSEALLTPEERKDLQSALQWFGFYSSTIDGAFGPGTRNSMAAWQEAQGLEPTGILTTRQRRALLDAWSGERAAFGFQEVVETESGITVTLPLALVEFDHYEPPFVHYRARTADAPRIVLISQPGGEAALYGLYDVLQTLESVPLDGARDRDERSFRIRGTNATTDTTAFADLKGERIKGWMLISTPGNEARDARILQVLEQSFKAEGDKVLDPGIVAMDAGTRAGLLSGLELRKPKLSRTGFFVSSAGAVVTTAEAVSNCGRVTIDRETDATVTLADAASGLALLAPKSPLSPRAVAGFANAAGRVGSEVTVPGYSYEDRLPAPTLTFGTLEDTQGLNGEAGLNRLALQSLPGDAGGAVLDASGAVLGMLLPAAPQDGKQLPAGVAFALTAAEIARILTPTGTQPTAALPQGPLAPAALAELGTGMTALVSCWD